MRKAESAGDTGRVSRRVMWVEWAKPTGESGGWRGWTPAGEEGGVSRRVRRCRGWTQASEAGGLSR